MFRPELAAALAGIERGKNLIVQQVVHADRRVVPRLEHDTSLGVAAAQPVLFEEFPER
jgi:hypothetical protein